LQLALSWTLSLSILALVPADIAATASGDEKSRPTLATLWDLSYWITFNLTWFVLPLHQIYEDAGDFTVTGRLLTSLKENLIFYAVLLGVALLGVVGLTANGAMTLTGVTSFSIASATSFGIVAGIFLLGYGVVEVPRTIWRSANIQKRPIQAYRKVGEVAAALRIAHRQLLKITTASETTNEVMPRNHDLRWMMRVINAETPKSADIRGGSSTPNQETNQETHEDDDHGGEYEYDYDETSDMVSLRRALKRKTRVYRRTAAQYVVAVRAALEAEAVLNASGLGAGGLGDRGCLMSRCVMRFPNPIPPPCLHIQD
jgi:YD repeat-containing protein